MKPIQKSSKLANVLYDVRGPIVDAARQMEDEGLKIIKLNIGNLAPFGFEPPEEIVEDMVRNLPNSAGYSDSKGIFAARKAVMHYTQQQGVQGVTLDDIYIGNGASDLIITATTALLNEGDELLVPAPDYPLWTAATSLAGGKPVHYICDENNGWMPDLDDIRSKITPRTKGIVVINPNNPTGALYSNELLLGIIEIAREHGLIIMADEVYDKVLYDGVKHTAMASLSTDVLTLTFNSLSKAYRAWIRPCIRSPMIANSSWKCSRPPVSCWCRVRASISPTISTSASSSCRRRMTCARPSTAWPNSWKATANAMRPPLHLPLPPPETSFPYHDKQKTNAT